MVLIMAMRDDRVIAENEREVRDFFTPRRCKVKKPAVQSKQYDHPFVEDLEVKRLASRYRLTQGQVRGLIARFGTDRAKLDAEAEKLRRY